MKIPNDRITTRKVKREGVALEKVLRAPIPFSKHPFGHIVDSLILLGPFSGFLAICAKLTR